MNRLAKLLQAAAATVIILTVGAVAAAEIEFKINPNKLPPCPKDLMFKEFQGSCWGTISLAGEIKGGKKITYAQSITYTGEFKRAKNGGYVAYGYGMKTYANGDKYVGEFKNGVRQGEGFQKYAAGGYYSGGWENDKRSGAATSVYNNGDYYFGEYQNDNRNGEGSFTTIGGTETTGTWKNGKLVRTKNNNESQLIPQDLKRQLPLPQCNGLDTRKWHDCFGTFFLEGGSKYAGTWKNGLPNFEYSATDELLGTNEFDDAARRIVVNEVKKQRKLNDKVNSNRDNLPACKGKFGSGWNNCFGKQNFKNGTYEGAFKNGLYDGFGIFQLENGEQYSGEFKSNLKHGFGRWNGFVDFATHLFDKNSSHFEWYEGFFENGVKHGKGIFSFKNGDIYVGEFKNDFRSGFGTLKYKSGDRYEGGWLNDLQEGHGSLYDEAGTKLFSGIYKQGKKSGVFVYTDKDGISETTYVDDVIHGVVYIKSEREIVLGKFRNGTPYGVSLVVKENDEKIFSIFRNGGKYISIKNIGIDNEYVIGIFDKEKFVPVLDQEKEWVRIKEELIDLSRSDSNVFAFQEKFPERIFYQKLLAHFQVNAPIQDEKNQKLEIFIEHSQPRDDGSFTVSVKTNRDTASLTVDGVEEGGSVDGNYTIRRVARAGQKSSIVISATDVFGNSATKTITVSRPLADSKPLVAALNPAQVKKQPERDAVAIIIGIADYKNLPRADYANDDARMFYDYAIRALGVKTENIKLLVDGDADDIGIYQTFKTWLPSRVRASTDVYVYYSGHGLPTADGQGIYLLPQRAHRDFIDKTAITQTEINTAIQAAKPRSVTVFLDACYSGQARTGETLLASARPVALKVERQLFPDAFTVISASQADQISSSSPDLKHGIFSYYLMRGMEGDADANRDGRITVGEMHTYLTEQVARQAGMMNRQQVPQLTGDANRVLVGR